jgi:uncharacterized membrane protein
MKYVAALEQRLRHLARPIMFRATGPATAAAEQVSVGQQVAERVAASVGSWAFIGAQAALMALWVLVNTLTFTGVLHFDIYPFVFLNLAMSAEAAFTGPILLIAANVGAIRDHAQADRIEHLTNESEQLSAQNRDLVQRLLNIEQLIDEHINSSLQAHTAELRELGGLVRAVHAAVCQADGNGASPADSPDAVPAAAVVAVAPATAATAPTAASPAPRARRQGRSRSE